MKLPGFVGGSYESQEKFLAGERTINLYPRLIAREAAKAKAVLVPVPGLSAFATAHAWGGRGLFADRGRLFGVYGGILDEIEEDGVVTQRGLVAADSHPASVSTNGDGGDELFIVSGDTGYILDLPTNVLTAVVTDVTQGGQVDGFFVALDAESSTLKISELLDGQTWDATQIAQRTAASDPWVAMCISRREMFLLGEMTGEVWYNAGLAPFPFAQRSGAFFEVGVHAPWSLAPFGSTMAWLGRTARGKGAIYWLNGYSPTKISSPALDWAIAQYAEAGAVSDAIGWSYEHVGHQFYVLQFPSVPATWVYDATTNDWHERGKWNVTSGDWDLYRPRFAVDVFGQTLVCDGLTDALYALSTRVYTDAGGDVLRRVRRTPHLANEHRAIFVDRFELEAKRGVGLVSGQGSDPQIMLAVSRDGGQTWDPEQTVSVGAMGAWDTTIAWTRLGRGEAFVFEVSATDPVETLWGDAYIEARAGGR